MSEIALAKRFKLILLFVILDSASYFFTSRFQFFPPAPIGPSWIDHWIPYLPWTLLLYVSYYVLMFLPLLLCNQAQVFYRMLTACYIIIGMSALIFMVFPVPYIWREWTQYQDFLTRYLYRSLLAVDGDWNAFPSLHVSLSLAGALTYLWYRFYRKGLLFLIWGVAVSISTVTAKRHYFIDLVGGVCLAVVVVAAVNWFGRTKQVPEK